MKQYSPTMRKNSQFMRIIFLEKYITSNEYYSLLKYRDDDGKVSKKSKREIKKDLLQISMLT